MMMKLLILLFTCFIQNTFANELVIYIIRPQIPISWVGPSSLAITSGINSLGNDYAPIGHFAVEVNCSSKNRYGVNRVLTGMERANRKESQQITLDKKLGLGSLFYTFKGALQSSQSARTELKHAAFDGRLSIIKVPTLKENCNLMMDYLEDWIDHGSYQNYGGAKNSMQGEGAGCADFAMDLFKLATGSDTPMSWSANINVPYDLIGDGRDVRVEYSSILARTNWAANSSSGRPFTIGDTNMVSDWITKKIGIFSRVYEYKSHLPQLVSDRNRGFYTVRPPFTYWWRKDESSQKIWKKIGL